LQKISEIDVENSHREIIGEFAFVFILIDKTQELIIQIDFSGIVLTWTRLNLKARIVKSPLLRVSTGFS